MVQLGILTTEVAQPTLERTLDAVTRLQVAAVQLHFASAAPDIPTATALKHGLLAVGDRISDRMCEQVAAACAARKLTIAAVDGTFNLGDPDPDRQRTGLRQLAVLIGHCARLGTSVVTLCTGSRDAGSMWRRHPDNGTAAAWADLVRGMREAARCAEEYGVTLAFEPEINNIVDSPAKARRLLDEVGSECLQVTLDPANIFPPGQLDHMQQVLDDAFATLGGKIALAHAKDLDHDGDAGHLPAGHGRLDYGHYLGLLQRSGFRGAVILHGMQGLSEADMAECLAFVRTAAPPGFWSP